MGLFREKSLKRISSPEQLNDYMKVTGLSVWLIILAIIFILISACLWGVMGRLETKKEYDIHIQNEKAITYFPILENQTYEEGMVVYVDHYQGKITHVSKEDHNWIVEIAMPSLQDGDYHATILIESIAPLSFLWNG